MVLDAWRICCGRCRKALLSGSHVAFLEEGERAVHLSVIRDAVDESQQAPGSVEWAVEVRNLDETSGVEGKILKTPQRSVSRLTKAPYELLCPDCNYEIGSEIVVDSLSQRELLLDGRSCCRNYSNPIRCLTD
ncbi:hypothetical protein PINS_up000602 [Pythium insidiosum]|nr:hypothetical protein PINS_up000602 [Pythium insidiosum]